MLNFLKRLVAGIRKGGGPVPAGNQPKAGPVSQPPVQSRTKKAETGLLSSTKASCRLLVSRTRQRSVTSRRMKKMSREWRRNAHRCARGLRPLRVVSE